MKLEKLIEKKIKENQRDGIAGWGLKVDPQLKHLGKLIEVSPVDGCISNTCRHISHDPAAPTYKWIPHQGKLIFLGEDYDDTSYWCLRLHDEIDIYLMLSSECGFYDELDVINPEFVPNWVVR